MKPSLFPEALSARLQHTGIVAVLVIDHADDAVPLAEALLAGGINIMELTLRTPAALEALTRIVAAVPEMTPGIGTILEPEQADAAAQAGAAFGLAPGATLRVMARCAEINLPFVPGIATPSDIERALEHGCRLLKFFPAETGGGLKHLESMAAPYLHLGLKYIPLGGLSQENMGPYLKSSLVAAVGGSWIAKRDDIAQHHWQAITDKARRAVDVVRTIRG